MFGDPPYGARILAVRRMKVIGTRASAELNMFLHEETDTITSPIFRRLVSSPERRNSFAFVLVQGCSNHFSICQINLGAVGVVLEGEGVLHPLVVPARPIKSASAKVGADKYERGLYKYNRSG